MSNLKFVRDLFLESEELNRLRKFIFDDGVRLDLKNNAERLGIVYNQKYDPNFSFFKPEALGIEDTFKINAGYAYNSDGNVLTSLGVNIVLPAKNKYYWLKIRYKYSNIEVGTVAIGGTNGGLLTGLNTKFTEVLRGQPNFPAKIKLTNSANYTLEYEVNEVVSDATAYLQGSFPTFETGLTYAIVGTFTPGVYPAEVDKYPFQYDDFEYELVDELTLNTQPDLIDDFEFFVCRIISKTTGVELQDKRRDFIYRTRAERIYNEIPLANNPLIAIENIARKIIRTKLFYVVNIGIGFNIVSESRNNNLNKAIITGGYGGSYKSVTAFTTGDFDDWRYYYVDGDYSRIISSVKVGSTIELQVDCLKHDVPGAMICPSVEEVEFKLQFYNENGTSFYKNRRERFYAFTTNTSLLISEDELCDGTGNVDISTRVKTVFRLSAEYNLNISTYTVQDVGDVTSNIIKLTTTGGGVTDTAWRGIDAFCELEDISPDIYYSLDTRNPNTITNWDPNSTNPSTSTVAQRYDLYAQFYSDSGLTTPYTFTKNNLHVFVKIVSGITTTGAITRTVEYINVYNVNVIAANEIFLGLINITYSEREHPTLDPLVYTTPYGEVNFPTVFPDNKIYEGRTGLRGFTNLEQYYVATNLPTGVTKPNLNSDTDYIAPTNDLVSCPIEVPNFELQYGYSLNIHQFTFTAASGSRNGAVIADTQSGGYLYKFKQFNQDESVTIQANVETLAGNNNSGLVWVRVTWRPTGANVDTISQYQIPNNTLTTLPGAFVNLKTVNTSNF